MPAMAIGENQLISMAPTSFAQNEGFCESPEISSTEKCYFSRFLTSREHSKTKADVFKFKHTTPVTAKVRAAQNREVLSSTV